jgi:hypothetical protein
MGASASPSGRTRSPWKRRARECTFGVKLNGKGFALRVKAELEERLADPRTPRLYSSLRDLKLQRVELEGTGLNVDLVVYFGHSDRPGCVFAARWKDIAAEAADDAREQEQMTEKPPSDDDLVEWFAKLILINLTEQIEAVDLGLPEDCDPDAITWIG